MRNGIQIDGHNFKVEICRISNTVHYFIDGKKVTKIMYKNFKELCEKFAKEIPA